MSFKINTLVRIILVVTILGTVCFCCDRSEKAKLRVKYELKVKHNPIKEHIGEGSPIAIVEIKSTRELPPDIVTLHYQVGKTEESLQMSAAEANIYQVELPAFERGTRVHYFIEVKAPDGSKVMLPDKATEGERFQFTFKGSLSKTLSVLSVSLTILVLLFFVLAFLLALSFVRKGGSITKFLYIALIAAILFVIAVLPVGMIVHYAVFGTVFEGWPFGKNIADTASLLLVIFWVLIFLGIRGSLINDLDVKAWFQEKVFAYLVIVGSILSFMFYIL